MDKAAVVNRVHDILVKIVGYQHIQSGCAVALDALVAAGALSSDDRSFLEANAIEYKPHDLNSHHAGDTFHVPTEEGSIFVGVGAPPLPQHQARLSELATVIEHVLRLPVPADEISLDINLSEEDFVGIAPGILYFMLLRPRWRTQAGAVISVATEYGLSPFQDSPEMNGKYLLSFLAEIDPAALTRIVIDLLTRGFGLTDEDQITYHCGALEAA